MRKLACIVVIATVCAACAKKAEDCISTGDDSSQAEKVESLLEAIKAGNMPEVKALLASGVSVNSHDSERRTPLWYAAERGDWEMVQALADEGAIVNLPCRYVTPLGAAAVRGHKETVEILIRMGADVNAGNVSQYYGSACSPLYLATSQGHREIVEILVSAGADVNPNRRFHDAPLHTAASCGHLEIAEFLIREGADVNDLDEVFCTPMDYAKTDEMIELLRSEGGKTIDEIREEKR